MVSRPTVSRCPLSAGDGDSLGILCLPGNSVRGLISNSDVLAMHVTHGGRGAGGGIVEDESPALETAEGGMSAGLSIRMCSQFRTWAV